jgi:Protein of unknown function (DUF2541)
MRSKTHLCLAAAIGMSMLSGTAMADSRHLGSTRLSHQENDTDVVRTGCKPRINAIKLEAKRGQVEIEALWVRYRNGESERLEVRDRIAKGGETRWIDLRGGKRCVVAVGVIGDTELSLDQARVDIYGRW